ncbi:MAG: hypothetical protein H7Z72_09235 [Bacteroidetes bacterium]|nr:hypothetical protein [Fibrella sp.]
MENTPQTSSSTSLVDPDKQDAAFDNVGSGATSGYGDASDMDEEDEPGDDLDADDDLADDELGADDDLAIDDLEPDDNAVLEGEPLDEDIEDDLDDDL